jgi:hypothetical protein
MSAGRVARYGTDVPFTATARAGIWQLQVRLLLLVPTYLRVAAGQPIPSDVLHALIICRDGQVMLHIGW